METRELSFAVIGCEAVRAARRGGASQSKGWSKAGVMGWVEGMAAGKGCDSMVLGCDWEDSGTEVKSMWRRSIMFVARLTESEAVPEEFMYLFWRVYHERIF